VTPLRIFIGYDQRESIAFSVLAHSLLRRSSIPVSITPLSLGQLGLERDADASTEFTRTRFLVPHLSDYQGVSIFMDCDMLCRTDVRELALLPELDKPRAVWVVRHDYTPSTPTKFLDQPQAIYTRKNWSSLMVFDNSRCQALTPHLVKTMPGSWLHRFSWCADEDIGTLDASYNWLVGEYEPNPKAKLLHYTLGGPWFDDYRKCDHAEEWFAELEHMLSPAPRPRTLSDLRNERRRG
jgi:hypothetical protein